MKQLSSFIFHPSSLAKTWLEATRPKTLPAAIAPVIIGVCMGGAEDVWHWGVTVAILVCALLIQIGTNFANDYFDGLKGTDRADRVGPTRATAAGLVTPAHMRHATVGVFALAALIGLYLALIGGWPIVVIGVLSIACGVLYTAGPYALGYLGLGEFFVLIFFGPVAVGGTYYLLTHTITEKAIVAGLAPGLLSCAVLVVNNYRDRHTDKVTGKNTLVVRLGGAFGRAEYAVTVLGGCLIPVVIGVDHRWCWMGLIALIPGSLLVRQLYADPSPDVLNRMLAQTGQVMILYSVLFSAGWLV